MQMSKPFALSALAWPCLPSANGRGVALAQSRMRYLRRDFLKGRSITSMPHSALTPKDDAGHHGGCIMLIKKKTALLASLLAAATISLAAGAAQAKHGGGGGGGGGHWHGGGGNWGGMGGRPHAFSGGGNFSGGRHFRHHRGNANVFAFGFAPYYADYGYAYGDGCYWLKRRALYTGSRYWWNRYYGCVNGYGY